MDIPEYLRLRDNLERIPFRNRECFIHDKNKFTLPISYYAQKKKYLPRPCTLVMLGDYKHKSSFNSIKKLSKIRHNGIKSQDLIGLCEEIFNKNDFDWLKISMELGLIEHAIILGDSMDSEDYLDHKGKTHRIIFLNRPRIAINYLHSKLLDSAQRDLLSEFCNILRCEYNGKEGLIFRNTKTRILFGLHLDLFTLELSGQKAPLPDEYFQMDFLSPPDNPKIGNWESAMFFASLIKRAGLVTIAREIESCGGMDNSNLILNKINKYVFDNKLQIEIELIRIPEIPIKWSKYYTWEEIECDGRSNSKFRVPNNVSGVYEVRVLADDKLLICHAAKCLRRSIKEFLIQGKYAKNILENYRKHDLVIRWCETQRPLAVEEQLRYEYKELTRMEPEYL